MTRAIILAAGRGSRMGSQTENKPKCLTILNGKSLLEWQLNSLKQAGVDDIELVTGYKSKLLQRYVSRTHLNPEWAKTNMVSSLFCASPFNGDTIISYSDITYSHEHVLAIKNSKHDIVITADINWLKLWSLRFENPLDDAETFISRKKNLVSIGKKTNDLNEIQAQFMGLLKLSQKGWLTLQNIFQDFPDDQRRKMDMTSLLGHLLEKKVPIFIEFVKGKWCECDTYNDVLIYEKLLEETIDWSHDWRN
tara:strand:- start:277 stop:1026 length:750 start_codon:yes stop_codon:yes gene_type:complete